MRKVFNYINENSKKKKFDKIQHSFMIVDLSKLGIKWSFLNLKKVVHRSVQQMLYSK